jgi:hypothetical protein
VVVEDNQEFQYIIYWLNRNLRILLAKPKPMATTGDALKINSTRVKGKVNRIKNFQSWFRV